MKNTSLAHKIFFSKISLLIELAVLVLLAATFFNGVTRQQAVTDEIKQLQTELSQLKRQESDLAYRKLVSSSAGFVEVKAKQKLNLQKPGEKIVVFTQANNLADPNGQQATTNPLSHIRQWFNYFFGQ